ncbi:hypothetical protein [Micromonospora sp. KC723]|uniref:hypothetical protein n=1 Tax=Micromonospora sp. KC723 TaxID=2530381 RepID=UPI0010459EFF|nr:hypothetical protein [Micromonospora sp. KC723]TDB77044.1 hypothetical protein E1165_04860 [Micromonospora sp. KC723]
MTDDRAERGYEMARDDAARHTGGTEPPPHHRRPYRWSGTRPGGSRPERARPAGGPSGSRRPAR